MNSQKRQSFKKLICEQIEKVQHDIESFSELAKPVSPDNAIGRLSRMEAISEKSINEANLNKSKTRLMLLQKAKERVNTENFGVCFKCEEPIPEKRLQIIPESTLCLECIQGRDD